MLKAFGQWKANFMLKDGTMDMTNIIVPPSVYNVIQNTLFNHFMNSDEIDVRWADVIAHRLCVALGDHYPQTGAYPQITTGESVMKANIDYTQDPNIPDYNLNIQVEEKMVSIYGWRTIPQKAYRRGLEGVITGRTGHYYPGDYDIIFARTMINDREAGLTQISSTEIQAYSRGRGRPIEIKNPLSIITEFLDTIKSPIIN